MSVKNRNIATPAKSIVSKPTISLDSGLPMKAPTDQWTPVGRYPPLA
jgi:hypothetical protein